jgi:hypothetical protein
VEIFFSSESGASYPILTVSGLLDSLHCLVMNGIKMMTRVTLDKLQPMSETSNCDRKSFRPGLDGHNSVPVWLSVAIALFINHLVGSMPSENLSGN